MSKSPYRLRGDAAEVWQALLFGEIVRSLDQPITVRDEPTIKLPGSGRWEGGLAQIRPALDDTLGSTAFAVAWRWACAEQEALAWPGLALVAQKATDRAVQSAPLTALATSTSVEIRATPGDRSWVLEKSGQPPAVISITGGNEHDWAEVDRLAAIVAAWLESSWKITRGVGF